MTLLFSPSVPSWATHIIHDLATFKRWPVPVERFAPFSLPEDAYFEYAFRDAEGNYRADPLNEEAHNPWYDFARSVFGPAYQPGRYNFHRQAGEPQGTLVRGRLRSRYLGQRRRWLVYTPRGLKSSQAAPCVYVHDGLGFLYYGQLPQVLDAMLADRVVEPARLVLIPPERREQEYPHNEVYQRFVLEELVPQVESEGGAVCNGRRILLGASLGGLVSMLLAWKRPEWFDTVITLSGAFLTAPESPQEHHDGREWLREQVLALPHVPALRYILYCGGLEWLTQANRHVAAALAARGATHTYLERPAGHNWVNWRDGLGEVLRMALSEDGAGGRKPRK